MLGRQRKKQRKGTIAPDYVGYTGDKRLLDRLGLSASEYEKKARQAADKRGV